MPTNMKPAQVVCLFHLIRMVQILDGTDKIMKGNNMKQSEQITAIINRLEIMDYTEDLSNVVEDLKTLRLQLYIAEAPWILKADI